MTERGDGRDRAQILLVSALLLAVLFVGLAVVVNSAVYAENRATREATTSSEALADHPVTQERLGRTIHDANFGDDTAGYDERARNIKGNVSDWDERMRGRRAADGSLFGAQYVGSNNGTRISQDKYSTFMPNDPTLIESIIGHRPDPFGITDRMSWLVAPDVQTRSVNLTVKRESLQDVDGDLLDQVGDLLDAIVDGSAYFWMHFDDGNSEWRVTLVQNSSSNQTIAVVNSSDESVQGACAVKGDIVNVHLEENELVGPNSTTSCPAMSFTDEIGRHDVYFAGSDEINGTYSIIADRREGPLRADVNQEYQDIVDDILSGLNCLLTLDPLCVFDTFAGDEVYAPSPSDGDPYTATAVYNSTVELTYTDDRVHLTRNVSVPAES